MEQDGESAYNPVFDSSFAKNTTDSLSHGAQLFQVLIVGLE